MIHASVVTQSWPPPEMRDAPQQSRSSGLQDTSSTALHSVKDARARKRSRTKSPGKVAMQVDQIEDSNPSVPKAASHRDPFQ